MPSAPEPTPPSVPVCPACKAPLDDEHNLRSGAVCPTLEPPPYALCVCGHVQFHHGKQDLAQLPYDPHCQWRGCGCPRYLDAAETAGQEPSSTPGTQPDCAVCGGAPESTLHMGIASSKFGGHRYEPATSAPSRSGESS